MAAKLIPVLLLVAVIFISGCASPAATDQTLEKSMQEMKDFMDENPDQLTSTEPASEDQGFSANAVKGGIFENLNYMTSGSVEIQDQDGALYIVLGDDFSTPAGPDLVLYLTKNTGPTTRSDIRAGIELRELKSTTGMQVYEIPPGTDLSEYNSVTIHCRAFNIPWSYAKLA